MSSLHTTTRLTALAALAACALAAPAQAAYAPRVSVSVAPPTAGGPVALTLEIDQDATDEATRTVRVSLPGFGAAPGARARAACAGPAACQAESRIGSAASTTTFGSFSGGVYFAGADGERTNVVGILSNPAVPLLIDQRFTGTLSPVTGGRELGFDDLPGATATRLRIVLEGGERALVSAPSACRTYDLVTRLTSHGGQHVERTSAVAIGGCPGGPPALSAVALAPRSVPAGSPAALGLTLSEPAFVRVLARRTGTRSVRTLRRVNLRAGRTVLRGLAARLPPGLWVITVRATDADGTAVKTVLLRVRPRAA
jgi:hypothetical protein